MGRSFGTDEVEFDATFTSSGVTINNFFVGVNNDNYFINQPLYNKAVAGLQWSNNITPIFSFRLFNKDNGQVFSFDFFDENLVTGESTVGPNVFSYFLYKLSKSYYDGPPPQNNIISGNYILYVLVQVKDCSGDCEGYSVGSGEFIINL